MRSIKHVVKLLLALALCMPGWLLSAQPLPHEVPAAATPATGLGLPVNMDRLDKYRGGTETVSSDVKLSGTVADNAAINVTTGMNTINGAAFSNASGFPIVIQNSGANVLIQNATIINVQIK